MNEFIKKKISVVYPGIDFDRLSNISSAEIKKIKEKYNLNNSYPIIGNVAEIEPIKGQFDLIFATKILKDYYKNIKCLIIGDTRNIGYFKFLVYLVNLLNLKENVIFTGFQDKIGLFYSLFDVFILPSIREELGIVVIEARYFNLPMIISNNGGSKEIVENYKNAYSISPEEPTKIAKTVLKILINRHKFLRKRNYKKLGFTTLKMVNKTLKFYKDIYCPHVNKILLCEFFPIRYKKKGLKSGRKKYILDLYKGFKEKKIEVDIFSSDVNIPYFLEKFIEIPILHLLGKYNYLMAMKLNIYLKKKIFFLFIFIKNIVKKYDIINVHDIFSYNALSVYFKNLVLTIHTFPSLRMEINSKFYPGMKKEMKIMIKNEEARAYSNANYFITVSEATKLNLIKFMRREGINADKK